MNDITDTLLGLIYTAIILFCLMLISGVAFGMFGGIAWATATGVFRFITGGAP